MIDTACQRHYLRSHIEKHFTGFAVLILSIFCMIFTAGCGVDKPEEILQVAQQLPDTIDYNLHVKPIISDKCFACHGPDKASLEAGLQLGIRESALASLQENPGKHAIVPGNLAKSQVYHRIIAEDPEMVMPPPESNLSLSTYEKAVLIKWIEQGAVYKPHWAFIQPEKYPLPKVQQQDWPKNAIDYFVLNKLEENGLPPAKEADKETLIRRVSLDLTGLPPSVEEVDAFLADESANAYEKVVDRLLSSPHYGENMAVDWLDVARYADTHGYSVDRYRPMWPWRDWVIKAFNKNMPYDQFVTWQLAGDLLPNATREQKLATGFNRNHSQNMEGGIVNEEFRVEYVSDRTNTLGKAFLGLTVECAHCHDHKYDPISQKEYYQLFAFFNNVEEAGQISWDDAMPVPTMLLTDKKQDSLIAFLDEKIEETNSQLQKTKHQEKDKFENWYRQEGNVMPQKVTKGLQAHFTLDKASDGRFLSTVPSLDTGTIAAPEWVDGKYGKALKMNGDEALDLGKVGIFSRANPFSVGLWVKIPEDISKGVIFHTGYGDILYNFRGYYLNLRDNKLELLMAHTWPYNNIIKLTRQDAPKEEWIHLMMTYDGSSKAKGLKLYINGRESAMSTEKDNLYKDILLPAMGGEAGLRIGADYRGTGFTNGLVDDIMVFERELTSPEIARLADNTATKLQTETADTAATNAFFQYYLANFSTGYQQELKTLEKLRERKNKVIEEVPEIMIMDEMEEPRPTYVLERGVYDAHGAQVQPGTPESVLPFPDSLPPNRLGLARWLMAPDNPLTARVIVNRYWQNYFGRGLVKTSGDFGNQGEMPSHPKLLDWLAVTFRESGWDIKAMQKRIVMSATYRQSSFASPELIEKDPENILLARAPAFRLTAEMLRDNALAASGLLVETIGGPSVRPYQPDGLWSFNGSKYEQDTGDKLYHRSLYTIWKRTIPHPSMSTFDAPSRSYCVVQRQQTSTPLQALILLNDPQFVEAAKVIAEKVTKEKEAVSDRLTYTFRLLTSRKPKDQETSILTEMYQDELTKFKADPTRMQGWLHTGDYRLAEADHPQALAALTVVASTIMNSDAFITRR